MSIGIPFGRYRLTRRLARGGMAEVFLATQQGPGGFERTVAVKRILPHLADTPQFLEMFMDEARLAAQLSHPNIAHIYEFGNVDDSYFIAMEYIDGVDLSVMVLDGLTNPLPLEHAARIIADLCAALHYAHQCKGQDGLELGIVHRDISPQNILVSFDGAVKVVDFGIAKAAHHIERTKPGVVRGKYTYMSPEQVMGKSLDGRSDLFSVGIVLYELCTAAALFPRTNAVQAMQLIRRAEIPQPKRAGVSLPARLTQIIKRALAQRREDRYQAAAEMQMELEEYLRSSSRIVNSIVLGDHFKEHYRRHQPEPKPVLSTAAPGRPATFAVRAKAAGTVPVAARAAGSAPSTSSPLSTGSAGIAGAEGAALAGQQDLAGQSTDILDGRALDDQLIAVDDLEAELGAPTQLLALSGARSSVGAEASGRAHTLPLSGAAGIIFSQATAPKLAIPAGLVTDGQDGHRSVDLTVSPQVASDDLDEVTHELAPDTFGPYRPDEAPPGATLDRATSIRTRAATLALPGSSAVGVPAIASKTFSVRSVGRRLLVVGLIAAVALIGVLVGLWISDPGVKPALGVPAPAIDPSPIGTTVDAQAEPVPTAANSPADAQSAARGGQATLSINSTPSGASISLDGRLIAGLTPLLHTLEPGPHRIEASYSGYEPQSQLVELVRGQTLKINMVLRPQTEHQIVQIRRPDSPRPRAALQAKPRRHRHRPGRARRSATAQVQPRGRDPEPSSKQAPPRQEQGFLNIFTVPWSEVYLDGKKIGITPLANVRVSAGVHQLRLVNPQTPEVRRSVKVLPGKVTKLRLRLK